MESTPQVGVTVVPADTSGFVSRAELKAHLDPMRSDISEVKGDVKTLLQRSAGSKAVAGHVWRLVGVSATLFCGVLAGVAFH